MRGPGGTGNLGAADIEFSAAELAEFEQQLAEAPTGEGVVGIIVLFLVVFIITDMLCATDLFPFVKCIR